MATKMVARISPKIIVKTLLVGALGVLVCTTARADLAVDFEGDTGILFQSHSTFGWSFELNRPVRVDRLGFFDDFLPDGPGLNHDHVVRIWKDDGSEDLLALATVTNASTVVPTTAVSGRWLFENIMPVILPRGRYVIGADDPPCAGNCDRIRFLTAATTMPAVELGTIRNDSPPGFPSATSPGRDDGYFGPNFTATPLRGPEFNADDVVDCADVDALVAEIVAGTHDSHFDMTGDLLVNDDDLEEWRHQAGAIHLPSGEAYLVGDANLDGNVDGQDFVIWNVNKFTSNPSWCSGDFDASGEIEGHDFVLWNANKFTSADATAVTVPEPKLYAMWLGLLGLALGELLRKKRSPEC